MANFGLIGAAGYIAPRHMKAIHEVDGNLVAAVDPHDCVGHLDSYFPNCRFFTEIERFDRHIEKLRRGTEEQRLHYISICSPNYLHDAHVRLALRVRAHAICEKPLVLSPWNLTALEELEAETGYHVYTVLQLRLLPALLALKQSLASGSIGHRPEVCLTYITRRGRWYGVSWKGQPEKSGGVAMNIGIHFFDMLQWLFGEPERSEVHLRSATKYSGVLELEAARVRWFLSIDEDDLPAQHRAEGKFAYRSMTLDGQEIEFSDGFTNLHTRVYEEILAGRGARIAEARPAIETVFAINQSPLANNCHRAHPLLQYTTVNDGPFRRIAA
ncbi:MAG: Gfo/Idh/MocA family oxidoreductase [Pirellulaceae bacterium]|nr:Gfo/Idh/MocA family oxidoreductase [Planctomycetales bacterium]MCA9161452.1 Gfo/Idh/MocA family oxidoreductase [Planctomycetales bacterium]MCA9202322.1 Gfo/Idh/MocA family oxidoreductase [Planctomycetales bacterium]MCA9219528.1 Gfo/Idh/MocA family oxidoreductase [Planctomycetales bacterium]MCA9226225.1 Gfo/Idh/MocA family oxidoreductase [Planctomycetales bacterium]